MGRKNHRFVEEPTPIRIASPPRRKGSSLTRDEWLRRREERERRRERAKREKIMRAVEWDKCIVPGCEEALSRVHGFTPINPDHHDTQMELPICFLHAAVIWNQCVKVESKHPAFAVAVADVNGRIAEREAREREAAKVEHLANVTKGDIYFIRLNGLVKVGWTRDICQRLKSYGASVELLALYPASRDDETNLHRQLTPARARGREWYEDGPIIQLFIDKALEQFGMPPSFDGLWTEPKRIVAGKRHR